MYLVTTCFFSVLSWVVAYLFHLKGAGHPYSWPYYVFGQTAQQPHGDRFSDLYVSARFSHFHEMSFFSERYGFGFLYPAPMALLYRIFLPNLPHAWLFFLGIYGAFVLLCAIACVRSFCKSGLSPLSSTAFTATSIVLSEVLLFEAHRLNFELFTLMLMSGVFFCLVRRRFGIAAVFLGVAISLKLYPFILLGVFFSLKKYRAMAISVAAAIVTTIVGLVTETPSFLLSARGTIAGLQGFSHIYVEQINTAIGWDHSFFALCKWISWALKVPIPPLVRPYMAIAAVAGVIFYLTVVRRLPVLNQMALLTLISITCPPVSFEYTLLQLYPVFALLCIAMVRQLRAGEQQPGASRMMICFGFLFSVQGWLVLRSHTADGVLKLLALICLMFLLGTYRIPDRYVFVEPEHQ